MALTAVEGLRLEVDGPVVVATIDRGDENLISMEMCGVLTDLLFEPPAGTRILHLRGAPPVFCLGRDRGATDEDSLRAEAETLVALNRALREGRLLTVAEVGGDAAGYGVGLAALCDVSFAAPGARFWFPEVEAGLAPTVVLAWLPTLMPRSHAFRLTATGARIDGREAARLGLVTAASASDDELPRLVAAEIQALLRCSEVAQGEIRSFLSDAPFADARSVDRMAVDRLVANSLRLRRVGGGELADR
ncbi:MAG TPA: enoyl-CoA hydratase/isomerase family protein [Acidimicrobiales bacterium]|nr:enoyl-CoA hydratase/isomerase family protein [Acidimicrobiales bacterium]